MATDAGSRKAQVTLFIIIGILLLLAVSLIYLLQLSKVEPRKSAQDIFNSRSTEAKAMMQSCVNLVGYDAISHVSLNSGYNEIPESIMYYETGLWYRKQVNIQPSLDMIALSMKEYFDSHLRDCINTSLYAEQGYELSFADPDSEFVFGTDDVILKARIDARISSGTFSTKFDEISTSYPIRYRRMWELSSMYVNMFLEPSFNYTSPLEGVDKGSYIVTAESPEKGHLIYSITDNSQYILGKNNLTLRFSYAESDSTLPREYFLQEDYETAPVYFPKVYYSLDRNAHLVVPPGATFSVPDGNGTISVVQDYPKTVTGYNLPRTNYYNASVEPRVFNKTWLLSNPVYEFGPTGLASSEHMQLNLYWDYAKDQKHGDLGILTNHSGYWHPIPSAPNNDEGYATTYMNGFSGFTLVDCEVQNISASFSFSPLLPFTYVAGGQETSALATGPSGPVTVMPLDSNPNLDPAYYLPIIMTITIPGWEEKAALICVDFTPTCDTIVAIAEADLKSYGSCQVVPPFNDVPILGQIMPIAAKGTQMLSGLTMISFLDSTNSNFTGQEQQEFELENLASYATIALQDFGKELVGFNLGGQIVNVTNAQNITTTGIKISFVYLQGGTTYKLCSVTKGCTVGQQCLTICGAIYP